MIRKLRADPAPLSVGDDLRDLDEALTAVVGAILQESNRTAGTIIGVAASKLVAAGVMAGVFGFAENRHRHRDAVGAAASLCRPVCVGQSSRDHGLALLHKSCRGFIW